MRKSLIIQKAVQTNKELAYVAQMGDDPGTDNVLLELYRANKMLDANAERRIFEHVSMGNKTIATRAIGAYDEEYLLRLPMSLNMVQELAKQLIVAVARFKLSPPPAWVRLAGGTFNLGALDSDIAIDEDFVPESERVSADI